MTASHTEPGLADRFALIVGGLSRVVAAKMSKDRTTIPLLMLLWPWLQGTVRRFAALAARAEAGLLPPPRHRPAMPSLIPDPSPSSDPSPPCSRKPQLPSGFAWAVRLMGWEAAASGSQLQHLLTDPEMAALLQNAPQLGRILRPLFRMLGQVPDPKILPRPPHRELQAAPPRPALRAPKPARAAPVRTEPYRRKPTRAPEPGTVWRKWRGIWMPEPIRKPASG